MDAFQQLHVGRYEVEVLRSKYDVAALPFHTGHLGQCFIQSAKGQWDACKDLPIPYFLRPKNIPVT